MHRDVPEQPSPHRRIFGMGLLLVGVALASVAATLLVLLATGQLGRTNTNLLAPVATTVVPGQTTTPTATPVNQGSLYTAAIGSLTRIDLKTGQVIWTINAPSPTAPLVLDKTLFFDNQDSSNYFLQAASVEDGKQLWRSEQYPNGFLLGAHNTLYDSTCNLYATSDPCHLYAINASTGRQLWSYDLPQGSTWIALQDGVLYGVSYTSYFALNATTGVPLWQKNLLRYTDQEANMTPVVSANVLSFASCNVTKQSSGFPGCYLYAFNAGSGAELWHMPITNAIQVSPTIMNGVIYAGTIDGTIYAVDEQRGTQLWTMKVGGTIGQLLAYAEVVYVEIRDANGQTFHIEALDAATHRLLWGQNSSSALFAQRENPVSPQSLDSRKPLVQTLPSTVFSAGPADNPFVLDHGLIYLHSSTNIVDVLNTATGSQITEYSVPGTDSISGFTVAAE